MCYRWMKNLDSALWKPFAVHESKWFPQLKLIKSWSFCIFSTYIYDWDKYCLRRVSAAESYWNLKFLHSFNFHKPMGYKLFTNGFRNLNLLKLYFLLRQKYSFNWLKCPSFVIKNIHYKILTIEVCPRYDLNMYVHKLQNKATVIFLWVGTIFFF